MVRNLKLLREQAGISQKYLGESIGMSQQSINKYENHNIEPDIDTLIALADYFDTSVDYLIGHTDVRRKICETQTFDLTDEESVLIDGYRKLSSKKRHSIRLIIENFNE